MNSIADVLALSPGPSWHESVALVQEIASSLQPGQPLPAAEDLLLESDGGITFGFAGESARPQVADLATLLSSLLEKSDAPHGLRDLASENRGDEPAHATIASFTRALAFYERPNRRSDLQALAGRLEGRSHAVQAERALAELRERVARKSEEETKRVEPSAVRTVVNQQRNIARARALAITAAVVVAALAVSALSLLRPWNSGNSPRMVQAGASALPTAPADGAEAATDALPPGENAGSTERRATNHRPVGTSATEREVSRVSPRTVVRAPTPAARPRAMGSGLRPVQPLPSSRLGAAPSVEPRSRTADSPVRARLTDSPAESVEPPVYTPANSEVTPPVWSRRQLPSEPSPDGQTGYFDIVIDTNGDVESVRLISPTRRYEERMLMSAAKAWKFRPARLNGEPVRYRMQVPITLTWTIDR